ncbi:MAG: hypothetical protein QOJ99_4205 [Bryobacterales bacterium]|jgi:hypothetical protein|nr:hypothetical protein [Bryobacterales bacterium]
MIRKWLFALIVVPALAFEPPAKPTPREKALQLLDGVVETAAAAQPQVAAAALLYVGQTYDLFDSKKAVEYLRQAFASTAAIPPGEDTRRAGLQARIASATAPLSLPDAIEMLKQIEVAPDSHGDPRQAALSSVLSRLLGKQQFDAAIELVNSVGVTGPYPFAAARQIFEKLPPDDNRRLSIFAYAMSAYALRPAPAFGEFLARRWKELPRSMVQTALGHVIENILNDKSTDFLSLTISSEKGSASLHNRQDAALFDLMHVVREIDPKRADEILESRKALAELLQKFPEGSLGMGDKLSRNSTGGGNRPDPSMQQQMALDGQANTIAEQAMSALGKKEPLKAVDLAKTIPVPERRVEVLTRIASSAGALDPTTAKAIIGESIDGLKDVKNIQARAVSWNNIAEAAHRAGDDKLAWEALDHSLADSAELYKADSDSDSPNEALRDEWPSTNAYRRAVITATKLMGIDAEPLLAQISDHDLALFARVEMAQALLERPHESWSTSVSRHSKSK